MEIKVGQWVRVSCGHIAIINEISDFDNQKMYSYNILNEIMTYCFLEEDIAGGKCAFGSKPQELIQIGDLIYSTVFNGKLYEITTDKDVVDAKNSKYTTKILTPNKDKSVYTLQYSKEERK